MKEMGSYLRKSLLFSIVFISMFSKERAGTRRLIENQLKVTGGSNEDNMYKIFFFLFFFFFFHFYIFSSSICSEWESRLGKTFVSLLVFSDREHLLRRYY